MEVRRGPRGVADRRPAPPLEPSGLPVVVILEPREH